MRRRYLVAAAWALAGAGIPAAGAAETCTAIADAASGAFLVRRGDCARRVTPASTFKIAISLMGYDAGFLKDEHTPTLPWRPGYVDWRASWKQSTDPAAWMRDSVVWYSQQVTRSLGGRRFAAYTRRFGYGNADVSGDPEHDGLTFSWIDSSLRISPLEQVAFLRRMLGRRLGVGAHAYAMTARLTALGHTVGGWTVHGKTGAAGGVGWYVGWAERDGRTLVFARLIRQDDDQPRDIPAGVWARDAFLAEFPGLAAGQASARPANPTPAPGTPSRLPVP
jgi:beta-lactamase class D